MLHTSEMTLLLAKETVDVLRTEELQGHAGRGQTASSCNALGITRALQHPACSPCARCLPQGWGLPCAATSSQGCSSDKSMQRETSCNVKRKQREMASSYSFRFLSILLYSHWYLHFFPIMRFSYFFSFIYSRIFFPGIGSIVLSSKLGKKIGNK